MPPPAITTSALSIPGHSPELEDELQRSEAGDVPRIERRRHLDHVEANRARAGKDRCEKVESLPRGHPAGRWNLSPGRSEEHTSELQSLRHLVCRLLLEKKKKK